MQTLLWAQNLPAKAREKERDITKKNLLLNMTWNSCYYDKIKPKRISSTVKTPLPINFKYVINMEYLNKCRNQILRALADCFLLFWRIQNLSESLSSKVARRHNVSLQYSSIQAPQLHNITVTLILYVPFFNQTVWTLWLQDARRMGYTQ